MQNGIDNLAIAAGCRHEALPSLKHDTFGEIRPARAITPYGYVLGGCAKARKGENRGIISGIRHGSQNLGPSYV
jgi:hypothetical protein